MQGVYLKFYVPEKRRHHGILAYEWLLEAARKQGIHGGSAFRAIAGFGRHGKLHEEHFFELAGDVVSVEVGFALTEEQAQRPASSSPAWRERNCECSTSRCRWRWAWSERNRDRNLGTGRAVARAGPPG
jgi:PII-like signaling protein